MYDAMNKVEDFHEAFNIPVSKECSFPDEDQRSLRRRLLVEEFNEYIAAEQADDMVEIADGLADLIYIACGTALSYGIPLASVFSRVHTSNMAKLGPDGKPVVRADGKVTKPAGWEPPKIAELLRREGWKG